MIRLFLKIIGASVLVLWWIIAGFLKKILDTLKLLARIKKLFADNKKNPKGEESR